MVLKLVISNCYLLNWLLVNSDFILAKRALMDDIHKVVQAAKNEASKQSTAQRQTKPCFEARYTVCAGDNCNLTMRTNCSEGRLTDLTEYHAISIFHNARLLVYDFHCRCLLLWLLRCATCF